MKLAIRQSVSNSADTYKFYQTTEESYIQYFEHDDYQTNHGFFKRKGISYMEIITILPLDNLEEL